MNAGGLAGDNGQDPWSFYPGALILLIPWLTWRLFFISPIHHFLLEIGVKDLIAQDGSVEANGAVRSI